jgi:hypothetical protein
VVAVAGVEANGVAGLVGAEQLEWPGRMRGNLLAWFGRSEWLGRLGERRWGGREVGVA